MEQAPNPNIFSAWLKQQLNNLLCLIQAHPLWALIIAAGLIFLPYLDPLGLFIIAAAVIYIYNFH